MYGKQIGVNHTAGERCRRLDGCRAARPSWPEDRPVRADAGDVRVLLVKRGGRDPRDRRSLLASWAARLSEGKLDGDAIECPWHASRFCVRDGSVVDGPATHPQPRFETRVRGGRIEVRSWPQE